MAIIINQASGCADKAPVLSYLQQRARAAHLAYEVFRAEHGGQVDALARQAVAGKFDWLVVCGGDGTITTVAQHLVGTRCALGVVPMGTFNYFARNLGLPVEPQRAVDVLFPGQVARLAVGKVNNRIFLNNASLGFYPELLLEREHLQKKLGRHKWSALLSGLLAALHRPELMDLHLTEEQQVVDRQTPLLYACCNRFQLAHFDAPGCDCVRAGQLALFVTHPVGRAGLVGLALRTFWGHLKNSDAVELLCVPDAWVRPVRACLHVALDGEVVTLEAPLHFHMCEDALQVILPERAVTAT